MKAVRKVHPKSNSLRSVLKRSRTFRLFEIQRGIKNIGSTIGFLVGFSDSLVLFHTLEMDTFRLNGYTAVRTQDISKYRVFDKASYWQFRSVRRLKLRPKRPLRISFNSFSELLKSVARSYSLVTLHLEKKNPDVCYIGALLSRTEDAFTTDDLDSSGEWTGPRRIQLSDLTKVDFGWGYEQALAVGAPKRPTNRK
jgi:hypothetical protein